MPSAAVSAQAYKRLIEKMKVDALDTYSCQVYDHVNLAALALASAPSGAPTGSTLRDHLRGISQDPRGKVVDSAEDGLKTLAAGSRINYDGASGPLEFADNGDVKGVFFRYEQIKKGKLAVAKIA